MINLFQGNRFLYNSLIIFIILTIISTLILLLFNSINLKLIPEIIITFTFIPIFILLLRKINGGLKIITPLIAFTILFFIFVYIGSTIHFYFPTLPHTSEYKYSDKHNYILFYLVNFSFMAIILGSLLANIVLKFNPKEEVSNHQKKDGINDLQGFIFNPAISILIFISIIGAIVTILQTGSIPLLDLFTNSYSSSEITERRTEFSYNAGIFVVFFNVLFPIILIILTAQRLLNKREVPLYIYLIFLFFTIFFATMSSHRGYLLEIFWLIFLTYTYIVKKINVKRIVLAFIIVLTLFIITTIVKYSSNPSYADVNIYILGPYLTMERFLFIQIEALIFITESFPKQFPFFYGETFLWDISVLLPGQQALFPVWLHDKIFPSYKGLGGTAPTAFLGDLYANFGLFITYLFSLLFGFLTQLGYILFIRSPKTIYNIMLIVLYSNFISRYATIGVVFGFTTRGIFYFIFIIALLYCQKILYNNFLIKTSGSKYV